VLLHDLVAMVPILDSVRDGMMIAGRIIFNFQPGCNYGNVDVLSGSMEY